VPGAHWPLQAAEVRPDTLPYSPAAQGVQAPAPAAAKLPAAHRVAVALVDPAGQAYPGVHAPVHVDSVSPVVAP
jgi:hypothetical protein